MDGAGRRPPDSDGRGLGRAAASRGGGGGWLEVGLQVRVLRWGRGVDYFIFIIFIIIIIIAIM